MTLEELTLLIYMNYAECASKAEADCDTCDAKRECGGPSQAQYWLDTVDEIMGG